MNSPAEDFKDLLILSSLGTGLVFATDLFIGLEPEINSTSPIVTLYDYPGEAPQVNFNYYKVNIQARIKGTKFGYQAAYTLAETVRDALHELVNQTVNGTKYLAIWAISDIFSIGNDENNRPVFVVNFLAHRSV
jgi:hypothetical protein